MTTDDLTTALRACAAGLCPLEAGTQLLISIGTFLRRPDFTTRFITCGTSGGTPMAAIDWDAAITAQRAGELPCSGGERRVLELSASLAAGIPVSLRDTITGLDDNNVPGCSPPSATHQAIDQRSQAHCQIIPRNQLEIGSTCAASPSTSITAPEKSTAS
jgi:hypothetical protein